MLVSDFLAPLARPLAPLSAPAAELRNPASWFDDAPGAAMRIGVELGMAGRGLSVAQHAERVLGHLCAEAEPRR